MFSIFKRFSIASIVLIATALFIGVGVYAASGSRTTATALTVTPGRLGYVGGAIVLSSSVKNATSCTFTSIPALANFEKTIPCGSISIQYRFTIPKNTAYTNGTYNFKLVVRGRYGIVTTSQRTLIINAAPKSAAKSVVAHASTTAPIPVKLETTTKAVVDHSSNTTTTLPPISKTNTIPVASDPVSFVVAGNYLWVASCRGNTLTEININTKQVVNILNNKSYRFNCPGSMVFDGTHIWVANSLGSSITELSSSTGKLVRVLKVPQISSPNFLAINGKDLWVINTNSRLYKGKCFLSEFNILSGKLVKTILQPKVIPYVLVNPLALVFVGGNIWVTDNNAVADEFNSVTGRYIRTTVKDNNLPAVINPMCITRGAGVIWVCAGGLNKVVEFNASTGKYIKAISGVKLPQQIIIRGNDLYVYSANPNVLAEYNITSGHLIKYYFNTNFAGMTGAIIFSGRYIWVVNYNSYSTVTRLAI